MKVGVKEEEEEAHVMDNQQSTETDGIKATIRWDESSQDISTDGSSNGNPPERCPRPLYSRDSTQEGYTIPHHHQHEEQMYIKVEVKEEEDEMRGDQQSKEEVGTMVTSKRKEASLDSNRNFHPEEEDQGGVLFPAAICPRVRGRTHLEDPQKGSPTSDEHRKNKKRRITNHTRNTRFSMEENTILIERVSKHWDKLFGHLSRQMSFPAKSRIWNEVVDAVNVAGVAERNVDTCKRRLNDIKRQIKTKLSEMKQRRGTGGGSTPEVTFLEYEEKLKEYLGPDILAGDSESDGRASTKQGPATASSRAETAANLDVYHNRRQPDEDSMLSYEDDEHSPSPPTSVQPEDLLMSEDNLHHRLLQSTEQLEEASCHSIANERELKEFIDLEKACKVLEPVTDTENARTAPAQHQEERHPYVRTSRGKRKRTLLQRRLATNSSNQLQDTLGKLMDMYSKQTHSLHQNNSTVAETIIQELRQTNQNLHQIAVNLAEQTAEHRNFCNQLLEEQKKISLALLVLVGKSTPLGPGGLNLPPNPPDNTDNHSAS
ncbi:uncharacterized protein [Aquarana catesbeiana]|uniref:uncharacterized protein isoform X2 n=1 Tax=Aquarana catesbeiana TaxID=8400 RepID=UPI003CC99EAF